MRSHEQEIVCQRDSEILIGLDTGCITVIFVGRKFQLLECMDFHGNFIYPDVHGRIDFNEEKSVSARKTA